MIKIIDINQRDNAERVLGVQTAAYKVEAEIIDYDEIPPLKDSIATLQKSGETFIGYYAEEYIRGVIAIKTGIDEVEIHRLVVHPDYFKKGIAQMLLNYVESHFRRKKIKVSTASNNTPAVNFYKKNGFQEMKETEINKQLTLTKFKKYL